jgi:hypothetical protein
MKTDEIKKRLEAATPGPWRVGYNDGSGVYDSNEDTFCISNDLNDCAFHADLSANPNDSVLIAHAPTDISNLLQAVEIMREALVTVKNRMATRNVQADKDEAELIISLCRDALQKIEELGK